MSALPKPDAATVLTRALFAASERLQLNQKQLARILGVSPATVSRMVRLNGVLSETGGEWDAAAALVRVYRSLAGLLDGNEALSSAWMTSKNHDFGCAPVDVLMQAGGVYRIGGYLDAYRGRF